MADIRDLTDTGEVKEAPQEKPMESKQIEGSVFPELEAKSIASVMGIERDSELAQYKNKIGTLLEYAKSQTTDHSLESLKWVIRSLELKIGTPPFAEKRINYIARYAYLMMEGKKIDKEKEQFIK